MVVFIHAYRPPEDTLNYNQLFFSIEYLISEVVCRVAVPLFFLISSVLLYKKEFDWKENLSKKLKTIVIPYLICNTIWISIFLFADSIESLASLIPKGKDVDFSVSNWTTIQWLSYYFYYPFLYPLWFLRDLFILNVFSKFLKFIIDKLSYFFIVFLLMIWILKFWIPDFINVINLNIQSFVFFSLGYYFVKYNISFELLDKIKVVFLAVPYIILTSIILLNINAPLMPMSSLCVLVGILLLIRLSKRAVSFTSVQILVIKYSKYVFIIYVFHEYTLRIFLKISEKILGKSDIVSFLMFFVLPSLTILLCIFFGKVISRYLPSLFALITGNR